ncbi:MAG: polynucleotide adenylyltransferase PcnB [Gammaproteobacteria bacterium]|nr:polynucleotide adenylyltransferase PcnB [Gammaproteobacteria bacterium]
MPQTKSTPDTIYSNTHKIQQDQIDNRVIQILAKLQQAEFLAYIVGGGVRDLVLGFKPKDFDIVTNATPEQIRGLFKNSRIIGKRFRLIHIFYGRDIIEVATFRAAPKVTHPDHQHPDHLAIDGQIIRDNIYGTLEEDIWRRDFTINALYYDPISDQIIDYCNGYADLKNHQIRVLGDPIIRYREDPVRMLRALRFSAKLDFNIESTTLKPLSDKSFHELLNNIPPARLFEEYSKLFLTGHAEKSFLILKQHKLIHKLFPFTATNQMDSEYPQHLLFLHRVLENTDRRIQNNLPINPAFLLAAFLWHPLQLQHREFQTSNNSREHSWRLAAHKIIKKQNGHLAIPKRFTQIMEEIWYLQRLFNKTRKKAVHKAATHPKFRAGFDFLLIRSELENINTKLLKWWQEYEAANAEQRSQMLANYSEN